MFYEAFSKYTMRMVCGITRMGDCKKEEKGIPQFLKSVYLCNQLEKIKRYEADKSE